MECGIDVVQDVSIKTRARLQIMSVTGFVYNYQTTLSEFEDIEKLEMLWTKKTYIYNFITPVRRGIERLWSADVKDLTPYETLCQNWREDPKRFLSNPNQLTAERDLKQLIHQRRVEARYSSLDASDRPRFEVPIDMVVGPMDLSVLAGM